MGYFQCQNPHQQCVCVRVQSKGVGSVKEVVFNTERGQREGFFRHAGRCVCVCAING